MNNKKSDSDDKIYEKPNWNKYKEYLEMIKHYSTIQFALLTVYMAFMGFGLNCYFEKIPDSNSILKLVFSICMLIISISLWVLELGLLETTTIFLTNAILLEENLGIKGYSFYDNTDCSKRLKKSYASTGITVVFSIGCFVWFFILLCYILDNPKFTVLLSILVVLLVVLVVMIFACFFIYVKQNTIESAIKQVKKAEKERNEDLCPKYGFPQKDTSP